MAKDEEDIPNIDGFIDSLSKKGMPAMATTVQKMGQLTLADDSRVSQLTEQILKDPTLTGKVLQAANSVIYTGAGQVNTITRAILLMGFSSIRDICLSMKILDDILKKSPSQHLKNVLAKSFHAAMQAKGIIQGGKFGVKEEVFISTLLHHLGEMTVLSRNDEISKKLDHLISNKGIGPDLAAREVLGFSFDDLTYNLAATWCLGDMMKQAVKPPPNPTKPIEAVLLGEELSQVAGLGWDSAPVTKVISKIADFRNIDQQSALEDAKEVADYAKKVANHYGADAVKHLIPPSNYTTDTAERLNVVTIKNEPREISISDEDEVDNSSEVASEAKEAVADTKQINKESVEEPVPAPRVMVEMDITPDMIDAALRKVPLPPMSALQKTAEQSAENVSKDISKGKAKSKVADQQGSLANKKPPAKSEERTDTHLHMEYMKKIGDLLAGKNVNINEMFVLILEAMNSALGLERVAMALLSKDRKTLKAKLFKGDVTSEFESSFIFKVDIENAFSYALGQAQPFWAKEEKNTNRSHLTTPAIVKTLGKGGFFVAPIVVSRKPIGVIYADQRNTGAALTEQQFLNFSMLAQQASIALSMLK